MEDDKLPHALLAIGIVGIVIFSICIAWLIVLCERCRRRRKFRPGIRHGGTIATSEEDWRPLPPANLVIVNKGFLSKSTPDILLDDAPTKLNRYPSFADSEPPFVFHTSASAVELSVHDQIAAILGTFPQVSYREASEEDPMLQTSTAVVHTPRRFPSSSEESSEQDNNESHTYQSTGGVGTVLLETTI